MLKPECIYVGLSVVVPDDPSEGYYMISKTVATTYAAGGSGSRRRTSLHMSVSLLSYYCIVSRHL